MGYNKSERFCNSILSENDLDYNMQGKGKDWYWSYLLNSGRGRGNYGDKKLKASGYINHHTNAN